ncbi:MAG: leucine-rich repeat protein [Oscillospiraceae bacterium]|nr:leucine-rich repeat protein [Oscillospiraceae bacterium]
MKHRIIAGFTALSMLCTALPTAGMPLLTGITAAAETGTQVTSDNLKFTVYSDHAEATGLEDRTVDEVVIPAEVNGQPVTSVQKHAFNSLTSLTSVTIPDSVTSIGEYAFYECTSLTSVTIPDGVTSIEWATFSGCTSLASITIPASVTSISGMAFYNTPWLKAQQKQNPLVIVNGILIDGTACIGDVVIPDSVTTINFSAFSRCKLMTSVTIPDSVTSIENGAFSDCARLESVTIPESVINIGFHAFSNCESLESVTILNPACEIDNDKKTFCDDDTKGTYSGVIRGHDGSTAQDYANRFGRTFVSLDTPPEDPTEPVTEPTEPADWRALYKDYLAEQEDTNPQGLATPIQYSLMDVVWDETPELFVSTGEFHAAMVDVFTLWEGKLKKLGSIGYGYGIAKFDVTSGQFPGGLENMGYSSGYYSNLTHKGKLLESLTYSHDYSSVPEQYRVNELSASEEEFNAALAEYETHEFIEVGRSYAKDNTDPIDSYEVGADKHTATITGLPEELAVGETYTITVDIANNGARPLAMIEKLPEDDPASLVSCEKTEDGGLTAVLNVTAAQPGSYSAEKLLQGFRQSLYEEGGNAAYVHFPETVTTVPEPTEPATEPVTDPTEPTEPVTEPVTEPTEPEEALYEVILPESLTLAPGESKTIEITITGKNGTKVKQLKSGAMRALIGYAFDWGTVLAENGASDSLTAVLKVSADKTATPGTYQFKGEQIKSFIDDPMNCQVEGNTMTLTITGDAEPATEPTEPTESPLGDVNGDTTINASDAATVLIAAAAAGAGRELGLTEAQIRAADVNEDSTVNASDAAVILIYSAAVGAGNEDAKISDFVRK